MYSLPELNDRRRCIRVGDVGGIFSIIVNTVFCKYTICYHGESTMQEHGEQKVFSLFPPTCVPVVPTAGPRQLRGEAVEEVENGPGEDHDVVYV